MISIGCLAFINISAVFYCFPGALNLLLAIIFKKKIVLPNTARKTTHALCASFDSVRRLSATSRARSSIASEASTITIFFLLLFRVVASPASAGRGTSWFMALFKQDKFVERPSVHLRSFVEMGNVFCKIIPHLFSSPSSMIFCASSNLSGASAAMMVAFTLSSTRTEDRPSIDRALHHQDYPILFLGLVDPRRFLNPLLFFYR